MKFEYKLNYDFVKEELSFQVTKMEESLRGKYLITTINGYEIWSCDNIELRGGSDSIYLPGDDTKRDDDVARFDCGTEDAINIALAIAKFQIWVEANYGEHKPVEMTIAQIEEKLGIHNLKIIKE